MKSRIALAVVAILALMLVAGVAIAFALHFAGRPLGDVDSWGQFGDYFGGLLNPLFAMLAFLAVLYSIALQRTEAVKSEERYRSQYELARAELTGLGVERAGSELLAVIRDIDARMSELAKVVVSPATSNPQLTYSLIVAEADRIRRYGGQSPAYHQFLVIAGSKGSVVEALVRELAALVTQMQEFLTQFSALRGTSQAPLIVYYANKALALLAPLEDAKLVSPYTRITLASVGDKHQ
jgi:uncharacterized membrane protein